MESSCHPAEKGFFRCWRCVFIRRLAAPTALFALLALGPSDARAQFVENFSSPVLDPAWTVVQTWPGGAPRVYGFTEPGNHFSLTDNPGFLRFTLDPMTHWDGFLNGYATTFGYHSCCNHDAGLEIHRTFSGDNWRLEAGGIFYLPFANGRFFGLRIYFGTGAVPTYWVTLYRGADVHANEVFLGLFQKTGPALGDQNTLEYFLPNNGWYYGENNYPTAPLFFRLERAGGVLTASWSDDGVAWNAAWSHDLGSALDGLGQRVVVAGLSWFVTAGSYADWDYISVTPTATVTALSPAKVWVGLKNSDDAGIKFDLKAEVFKGATLVGSGELTSVPGGGSGFNNARLNTIPLTLTALADVSPVDTLGIKVSVRNACSASGKNSGTARLWYNGQPADSGASRDAASRFAATIGIDQPSQAYYLRDGFALSTTAGSSKKSLDKSAGARCGPFQEFGTWSLTF